MGNLIIRKVLYSGDSYYFESPEFQNGINIIEGDNGSGKSTLSHFIDFGLGGTVKPFQKDNNINQDIVITHDTNNYVLLQIEINQQKYELKRFISKNDIFVSENNSVTSYPIFRHKDTAPIIFSDWLLEKLNILRFDVNLGTIEWAFNFEDLLRLLYHDQETEPSRIYKNPSRENFVSDSTIIRKTIFEVLLGISSADYFQKYNEMKIGEKIRNDAKSRLDGFLSLHPNINFDDAPNNSSIIKEYEEQLDKLVYERNLFSQKNSGVGEKMDILTSLQTELINIEIEISSYKIKHHNIEAEIYNIEKNYNVLENEIADINKIVFTHEQLNLFSMQTCPFCMHHKKDRKDGYCICGEKFADTAYEKFVYNSSEYKNILRHKEKSLRTIHIALESYRTEINLLKNKIQLDEEKAESLKNELSKAINSIEFSGNSQYIDLLNDKIIEVKTNLFEEGKLDEIITIYNNLNATYNTKKGDYEDKLSNYQKALKKFGNNNAKTLEHFNVIYNELMQKSSIRAHNAKINDNYMPVINNGSYLNKSAEVPIRLMYYFTILSLALKFKKVKHPRFLLIDTPETSGIDEENLNIDLANIDLALSLSKENESDSIPPYQVILTTGIGKYPSNYANRVMLRFNTEDNLYILKSKP